MMSQVLNPKAEITLSVTFTDGQTAIISLSVTQGQSVSVPISFPKNQTTTQPMNVEIEYLAPKPIATPPVSWVFDALSRPVVLGYQKLLNGPSQNQSTKT